MLTAMLIALLAKLWGNKPASTPASSPAAAIGSTLVARGDVPVIGAPLEDASAADPLNALKAPAIKTSYKSPLPKVEDEAWSRFVAAVRTAPYDAVSDSNALGGFEMKLRRLADLGLAEEVSSKRNAAGRMVWVGKLKAPMTAKKFLSNPVTQYAVFKKSVLDYAQKIASGEIKKPASSEMTLSGALAVLHRAGPGGLDTWADKAKRFKDTTTVYDRANGIF